MKLLDREFFSGRLLARNNESCKGDYGHLCLVCGCDSMPGAASLATSAALKSGCGLVTLHTSRFAAQVNAVSNPSSILSIDTMPYFSDCQKDWSKYSVIAAGPGLGRHPDTAAALRTLLESQCEAGRPMVLDADALNLIAADKSLLDMIPEGSVLTPHDGELARLISWNSEEGKAEKIHEFVNARCCNLVSKGFHTKVFLSGDSDVYENITGNPGMAKGGSGDVLTGLVGGLIARGYDSATAAMLAVWIHGRAGDFCTEKFGAESYDSSDIAEFLYLGFKELYSVI